MTIQEVYNKHYTRQIAKGKSHDEAVLIALDNVNDTGRTSEIKAFFAANPELKAVWDADCDRLEVEHYKANAAFSYHEVGKVFTVKFSDGEKKMVAVERGHGCYGCAFAVVVGRLANLRPVYGCKIYRNHHKHCNCSATYFTKNGNDIQVRADNKNVMFKFVK